MIAAHVSVERLVFKLLCKQLAPTKGWESLSDHEIANLDTDPSKFSNATEFKRAYVCSSFLRKWKGLATGANLEKVALDAWLGAERSCFHTNRRLEHEASTGNYSVAPSFIMEVQRKIRLVLGPLDVDRIAMLCRFGNGATSDLRRGTNVIGKMTKPTVTLSAIPYVCRVLARDEYMTSLVGGFSDIKVVTGNRGLTVDKNAKTKRTIAAEPTLNGFVQQGIGRHIRYRLKRWGIDLDDQTINQDHAFHALVDGLTTIDLKMASDTLCTNLVKLLLPNDWFEMLDAVRSPRTYWGQKSFLLSKFSSMGNAYTFELESLIFWALCSTAVDGDGVVSVYGDDIVVPDSRQSEVRKVLAWAGFQVNHDKSFTSPSRFFESCGKQYFDLEDVTPCYQKDVCRNPVDFVRLHNRLARAGARLGLSREIGVCTKLVRDVYRRLFPRSALPYTLGPPVEYDEYFIDYSFEWRENQDSLRLPSLCRNTRKRRATDVEEFGSLGWKLRQPFTLNSDPKGYVVFEKGLARTREKLKRHWRSSVRDGPG